jgi:hypothetical protein
MHMRIHSWYLALGIVGVSAVAVAGCTVNTTNNNGTGDAGDDASTTDDATTGTSEPDAATDTGTTPATDGSTPVVADAGDSGGSCAVALDTGSADCDSCVATSCCTQLTSCDTPDDAGVNDAGASACEQLITCINDFNTSTDAGVDAGAGESACNTAYTPTEVTTGAALLTCIRGTCGTQCPGI